MASQFFLHSCDWFGDDKNAEQDERDSAPALDRDEFVEKEPGGQRHEHVNKVREREGNRERNETQDIEPADETRDDEEDPVPDVGGGQAGNAGPVHFFGQARRFDRPALKKDFRGRNKEDAEDELEPWI